MGMLFKKRGGKKNLMAALAVRPFLLQFPLLLQFQTVKFSHWRMDKSDIYTLGACWIKSETRAIAVTHWILCLLK